MAILPQRIGTWVNRLILALANHFPLRQAKRVLGLLTHEFELCDRWGYSIRPIQWDQPIPDFRELDTVRLGRKRLPKSIDWQLKRQCILLDELSCFAEEIEELDGKNEFDFENPFFPTLDAAVAYAVFRFLKPNVIIEIGSGFSTQIADLALRANNRDGRGGSLVCVEPFPAERLLDSGADFELIKEKVENVDLSRFEALNSGDVLFVDSSHTVKSGGDVCFLILELLPILAPGVWVHFHDIWFPYDYPLRWISEERRAWAEQYLLEAFLAHNGTFQIRLASNLLGKESRDRMRKLWDKNISWNSSNHISSSFWIEKL